MDIQEKLGFQQEQEACEKSEATLPLELVLPWEPGSPGSQLWDSPTGLEEQEWVGAETLP